MIARVLFEICQQRRGTAGPAARISATDAGNVNGNDVNVIANYAEYFVDI